MIEPVSESDLARWGATARPLAHIAFWQGIVVRLIAAVRERDARIRRVRAEIERQFSDGDVQGAADILAALDGEA